MNIKSINDVKYNSIDNLFEIGAPSFKFDNSILLSEYTVQQGEEMRPDLMMESIYDDKNAIVDIDVILYINGIDNPLNILEGSIILYPDRESLDNFRYFPSDSEVKNNKIIDKIAVVNKTTRKDKNREKFVENSYTLPPVVLSESKAPIKIDASNIIIGGLG